LGTKKREVQKKNVWKYQSLKSGGTRGGKNKSVPENCRRKEPPARDGTVEKKLDRGREGGKAGGVEKSGKMTGVRIKAPTSNNL